MGLDISIGVDNFEHLVSLDYLERQDDYGLSRVFCDFMSRKNVVSHIPELDQIGKITGIDISSIYEMENYPNEEYIAFQVENAVSDREVEEILQKANHNKNMLNGNVEKVLETVNALIDALNKIKDLPSLLMSTDYDSLRNEEYFSDFSLDQNEGYVDNNFGQDLRNIKRFLSFARDNGTTTVWFTYG